MKFDLYSKIILAVIAICLVWICISDFTSLISAYADTDTDKPQKVIIVGTMVAPNGTNMPNIPLPTHMVIRNKYGDLMIVSENNPLPIKLKSENP